MITASVPRAVAHLDILRTSVISRLDAIATTTDATMRDAIIADTRVFVETYARAPLSARGRRTMCRHSQRWKAVHAPPQGRYYILWYARALRPIRKYGNERYHECVPIENISYRS
jgi:hypothetical protein